jgi:hypothetical protein
MPVKRPTNALTLRSRGHLPIKILLYICASCSYIVSSAPICSASVEAFCLSTQHTTSMFPCAAIYVSSCCYICASSALLLCVPTRLYMCPHAASYAAIYVSSSSDCRSAWRAATPSTRSMLPMSSVPWARTMKNRRGEFCKLSQARGQIIT